MRKSAHRLTLRVSAKMRLRAKRIRWIVFFAGVGWSSLCLAAAFDPVLVYGDRVRNYGDDSLRAYQWFMVSNPPTLFLDVTNVAVMPFELEPPAIAVAVSVSCAWWLLIAFLFRRRRAKVLMAV